MKHKYIAIGLLKIGDRFSFPNDYKKRIVSKVVKKHGYITTYHRLNQEMKSFHYWKEVIL